MGVLAVKIASDGATLRRRDPKVGASGVEDDLELLRRGADSNLGEVCDDVSGCSTAKYTATYTVR